jgi:hypothetical protein
MIFVEPLAARWDVFSGMRVTFYKYTCIVCAEGLLQTNQPFVLGQEPHPALLCARSFLPVKGPTFVLAISKEFTCATYNSGWHL